MSVFISYSHRDSEFVDRLSIELLNHNVKVWRDEYKLSGGDSLTERIRDGIDKASFLCVALSDSALASEWVKKEIAAGLLREREHSGFAILPLLIEDVQLPEELKDFLCVDFTKGFEEGIRRLVGLVQRRRAAAESGGSTEGDNYFIFWGTEGGYVGGRYDLLVEVVSVDREEQFCILTRFKVLGNEAATEEGFRMRGIESPNAYVLEALAAEFSANPARIQVRLDEPARVKFSVTSEDDELEFIAMAEVKMLGTSRGETTLFNVGGLFGQIKTAP